MNDDEEPLYANVQKLRQQIVTTEHEDMVMTEHKDAFTGSDVDDKLPVSSLADISQPELESVGVSDSKSIDNPIFGDELNLDSDENVFGIEIKNTSLVPELAIPDLSSAKESNSIDNPIFGDEPIYDNPELLAPDLSVFEVESKSIDNPIFSEEDAPDGENFTTIEDVKGFQDLHSLMFPKPLDFEENTADEKPLDLYENLADAKTLNLGDNLVDATPLDLEDNIVDVNPLNLYENIADAKQFDLEENLDDAKQLDLGENKALVKEFEMDIDAGKEFENATDVEIEGKIDQVEALPTQPDF